MSTAFLFPGQGSWAQEIRGSELAQSGAARELLGLASVGLGIDLVEAVAKGAPALSRTEVGQPALLALCIGAARELAARGIVPDAAAGHSVGELAAFAVAGCLSAEDAVAASIERGRLMGAAARRCGGGMLALRSEQAVEEARAWVAKLGHLELAAHNAPREWVVSGTRPVLQAVAARMPSTWLPVEGPWHSSSMLDAETAWRQWLERIELRPPRILLVANATGEAVGAEDLRELLAGQLTRPIRWVRTLETLARAPISDWRILGPGRTLRNLCRANLGAGAALSIEDGLPGAALEARPAARPRALGDAA